MSSYQKIKEKLKNNDKKGIIRKYIWKMNNNSENNTNYKQWYEVTKVQVTTYEIIVVYITIKSNKHS